MKKVLKELLLIMSMTVIVLVMTVTAEALGTTGQCGDKVYYTYDSTTKELVISGEGEMWDDDSPFKGAEIETLVVEEGITRIGKYSFWGCEYLSDITIGGSVTSIGANPFYGTEYYDNMDNWEGGILYIGEYLIDAKNKYSSFTIKDGTKIIADDAFRTSENLTNITIPDSVTNIGNSAFERCWNLTDITIPDNVISIGNSAFEYCYNLTNITIPNSVVSIGDSAFYDCSALKSIEIGSGIRNIGENAFEGCENCKSVYITNLKSWCNIDFGNHQSNPFYNKADLYLNGEVITELIIPEGVSNLKNCAFYNCDSIQSLIIPDSVTSVGSSAFDNCINLTSITLGNGVINIDGSAFGGCNNLISLTIPASLAYIGSYAFNDSIEKVYITDFSKWFDIELDYNALGDGADLYVNGEILNEIIVPEGVTAIKQALFKDLCSIERVVVSDSVTSIGAYAFDGCINLTSLTIGNGVKDIGAYAFGGCSKLESIDIPKNVSQIGRLAFFGCSTLNSINVDSENQSFSSDSNGVLFDKNYTEILWYPADNAAKEYNIPDTVTSLGYHAMRYANHLQKLGVPASLIDIDLGYWNGSSTNPFGGAEALKSIIVDSDNPVYSSVDGVLFNKEGTKLLKYPGGRTDETYTVPDKTKAICAGSFYGNQILKYLIVPVSVKEIETYSLYRNNNLTVYYEGTEAEYYDMSRPYDGDGSFKVICENKHTHFYTSATKAPTCTTVGTTTYTCSCGDTYIETIKAKGHTVVTDKAVAATCTKTGLTAGSHCSECKAVITKQTVTAKKSHTSDKGTVTKNATYKATGTKTYKCTACETVLKTEEIQRLTLSKASRLKASSIKTTSIKFTWSKETGAEKYEVYYSTNGKSWKKVTATKNSVTIKNLKSGTTYKVKVRAVAGSNKGSYSSVLTTSTKPSKVTLSSVKSSKKKTAVAAWKTVSGASGYEVVYSTSKKFTSKTTKKTTIKKQKTKKTILKKLKSGKKYFVKVRAYKTVGSKKIYGTYSAVKTVKVK